MSEKRLNPAQKLALSAIKLYQDVWSPDHSPRKRFYPYGYCRFTPTCSQYGYEAIEKYGLIKGGTLALWRISRCNQCSRGGYDPVK